VKHCLRFFVERCRNDRVWYQWLALRCYNDEVLSILAVARVSENVRIPSFTGDDMQTAFDRREMVPHSLLFSTPMLRTGNVLNPEVSP